MRLNRSLNLVLPIYAGQTPEDAETAAEEKPAFYVHSVPVGRELFQRYYRTMGRAISDLANDGLAHMGPRFGMLALKDAAEAVGDWQNTTDAAGRVREGVESGLLGEIRRLTNAILPDAERGGWRILPLEVAVAQRLIDDDDLEEVMQAICFFTCNSPLLPPRAAERILSGMFSRFGAEITSRNCTEYAAFLRTSTLAASSGEPAPREDVRSSADTTVERLVPRTPATPAAAGVTAEVTEPDGTARPLSVPA